MVVGSEHAAYCAQDDDAGNRYDDAVDMYEYSSSGRVLRIRSPCPGIKCRYYGLHGGCGWRLSQVAALGDSVVRSSVSRVRRFWCSK